MPEPFVVPVPSPPLGHPWRLATPFEVRVKPGTALGAYLEFAPPPRHTTSGQPKHHPDSPGLQYRGHATVGRHFLEGGDRIRVTEVHVQVPKGIPNGNPFEVVKGVVRTVKGKSITDRREYFFYLIDDGSTKTEPVSSKKGIGDPRKYLDVLTAPIEASVTKFVQLIVRWVSESEETETRVLARWLLDAESDGVIEMRALLKEDLQSIADGTIIRDSAQQVIPTEAVPILPVIVRAVRALKDAGWAVPVLKCGTFLRWEDDDPASNRVKGRRRPRKHGRGEAMDLPMEMSDPGAVEKVAAILGSLDPAKKYGVGLPAQDPFFFRPQDLLGYKKALEEEKPEVDRSQSWISGLVLSRGVLFRTRWLADEGKWAEEQAMLSGPTFAYSLLQSRPGWAAIEDVISRVILFPDAPDHLHLDIRS